MHKAPQTVKRGLRAGMGFEPGFELSLAFGFDLGFEFGLTAAPA